MEKLNALVSFLKEASNYDDTLKKDGQALVRILNKLHTDKSALKSFDQKITAYVQKAQCSQVAGKFPKNFFVRLYGSVLEFEHDCSVLTELVSK